MKLINETNFRASWLVGSISPPQPSLSIMVKASFQLRPNAPAQPLDAAEQAYPAGDEFFDAEKPSSLTYEADSALFKPRCDVTLNGTCYPPNGEAQTMCSATLAVGAYRKSVLVYGDRQWRRNRIGMREKSAPLPFTALPLRYENSYGGENYAANPIGKGASKEDKRLPNIEAFEGHPKTVAGFGPINRSWEPRSKKMGTYDAAWLKQRWPWFPQDFDWRYYNAAPEDQQLPNYLQGDETLYFENLHPQHARYRSQLPGLRLRAFLSQSENPAQSFYEVPLKLDTLSVDMDTEKCILIWRGVTDIQTVDYDELKILYLVSEDLATAPKSLDYYRLGLVEQLTEHESATVEKPEKKASKTSEEALSAEMEADNQAELDMIKAMFAKAGMDTALADKMMASENPVADLFEQMQAEGLDPEEGEKVIKQAQEKLGEAIKAQGGDPDDVFAPINEKLDEGAASAKAKAKEKEAFEKSLEGSDSLAERDFTAMDLSGRDFSNRDLTGAVFSNANLTNTNFANAQLNRAQLANADLSSATLTDAQLIEADLQGAKLLGANLHAADLTGANLTRADLTESNFEKVLAVNTNFTEALANNVNFSEGVYQSADFTRAELAQADFSAAQLGASIWFEAKASGVNLKNADITKLRANRATLSNAQLISVQGEGAIFTDADLSAADLSDSVLAGASFGGAQCLTTRAERCDLSKALFRKASLNTAVLRQSNGFRAIFERADLSNTDMRACNLYEAEFLDAKINNTRFEDAYLVMTKLASKA